ncbi:MAG TPA: hypothetical protein VEN31_04115 [Candidatus Bathyarchaeia archaeon]|nr:hypothetical protein [Candidatus Bathyarchaeia archaeon]
MRRAVLAVAVAIGLAIGSAIPTAAIGLTQVNLSCDDGTSTTLVVDTDTLTGLTAAVQAMIDYPAGLTCTLVQVPLPLFSFGSIALAASPGQNPFIVGGGRWQVPCSALGGLTGRADGGALARAPGAFLSLSGGQQDDLVWVNIAVNVHQRDDGTPYGTLNETIPANQSCTGTSGSFAVGESHFSSTPTCVLIAANLAYVTSHVTQTSGQRAFPADQAGSVNLNNYVHFGFQDNGSPSTTTDTLNGPPATKTGDPDQTCTAATNPPPVFDLVNGNISIRNS